MGICGVQRMYLGQPGLGIALLFTFGFCGVGQIMDLILLPDAVKQANLRIGASGSELAATIPTFPQSQPSVRPQSPQASSASLRSADDDEFDQLLSQAEKSVSRTQSYLGDDDGR